MNPDTLPLHHSGTWQEQLRNVITCPDRLLQHLGLTATDLAGAGLGGVLRPGAGIAIEPQRHPDALNRPEFPSILSAPDAPYYQKTELKLIESSSE